MRTPEVAMIDEPRVRLHEAVRHALASRWEGIVRVAIPVEPTCVLTWLYAQPWPDRVFWSGRDDGLMIAGAGVADKIEAPSVDALEAALQPRLDAADGRVRYFGSMRFQPMLEPADEWQPFGRIRFVLPRVELRVQDGEATLAVNIAPGESVGDLQHDLGRIVQEPEALPDGLPNVVRREDHPSETAWRRSVESALAAMQTTDLEKVVLARRASFEFDGPLDPFVLLDRIRLSTQNCFHALIGLGQGIENQTAFLTATPERLFQMDGREVVSEAVAGTRLRSSEEDQDSVLRDELLHSEKDRREHAYVLQAICSALDPITETLVVDRQPSSFNLSKERHLRTIVKGVLDEHVTAFDLLRSLHPTPAVAGTPLPSALSAITHSELFDRGLYAGPIGWIGRDAAEFAVGIRSGLVEGAHLHLYSGAGIVEGSDPEAEWDEIEHKLDGFSAALGVLG
ncbi:MAG: isochorismate synthase [Bacteroidetes bacterium]|nr:isochorismate synthase [Bacteroidota bacterium]